MSKNELSKGANGKGDNGKGKVVQAELDAGHDPDLIPIKQANANYIVIAVVVLVGVFFGMGPVITAIGESQRQERFVEEVSNAELRSLAATAASLATFTAIPEFQGLAYQRIPPDRLVGGWILNARIAEQNGLVPRGETLNAIVADFLQQDTMDGSKTVLQELRDRQGTPQALQIKFVEKLLQLIYAGRALEMRYAHAPLVAKASSDDLAAAGRQFMPGRFFGGDQVSTDAITLRMPDELIEAAMEAKPEAAVIQATYQELQDQYFKVPEKRTVSVFAADPEEIAPLVVITDADVAAAYNEDVARWTTKDEEGNDVVTSLEDATATLRTELQQAKANDLADLLINDLFFNAVRQAVENAGKTSEVDLTLEEITAAASGLQIADGLSQPFALPAPEQLTVTKTESGRYLFGRFGSVEKSQLPTLFNGDVVGDLVTIQPRPGLLAYIRVDQQIAGSYRTQEQVEPQILRYLAARAAYPSFFAEVQELRKNAATTGGDLVAYFSDENRRARYQAEPAQNSPRDPMLEVRSAPAELAGQPGATQALVDLIDSEASVEVVLAQSAGGTLESKIPRLELLSAREYIPAGNQNPEQNQFMYRYAVRDYQSRQLQATLADLHEAE